MSTVRPIASVPVGDTGLRFAQGVRAGQWLFFTGHEATDYDSGIVPAVAGVPALPLAGKARTRREGDFILGRLAKLVEGEGSNLRHIIRVDQFYPTGDSPAGYHHARKALLKDHIPPSTSAIMNDLLVKDARMNVSMMAVMPGSVPEPKAARPADVPVAPTSGFIPSLVVGDYVFVAGQLANNVELTGVDSKAFRPKTAPWANTDIRLQTEVVVSRLKSALAAGGSSFKNAVKAQVYLTDMQDLPEFMDVWNAHVGDQPCALTVVNTQMLGVTECKVEINIFGVRDDGKIKKEIIKHKGSESMRLGPAAVRAGDLLCPSALYAADSNGAIPAAIKSAGLRHLGVPVNHQMNAILGALEDICKAGGTSLENLLRVHHFVGDITTVYPALQAWHGKLNGAPIPFAAVAMSTPTPVPGCDLTVDAWFYCPGK
ncbi:RidA family protein [Bradyrhizobium sp. 187]|uniref:RidA family protein n=1 Tax=Bradyrhizobium sp. 187 TaxID=2782655 RepID=UPI001FFF890F|nr:RidA family protein [Bradyrhizobium sp. 187]UPJ71897.1 hypothetical protein IVB19_30595 [Bradyrhizobium sp. 187]